MLLTQFSFSSKLGPGRCSDLGSSATATVASFEERELGLDTEHGAERGAEQHLLLLLLLLTGRMQSGRSEEQEVTAGLTKLVVMTDYLSRICLSAQTA